MVGDGLVLSGLSLWTTSESIMSLASTGLGWRIRGVWWCENETPPPLVKGRGGKAPPPQVKGGLEHFSPLRAVPLDPPEGASCLWHAQWLGRGICGVMASTSQAPPQVPFSPPLEVFQPQVEGRQGTQQAFGSIPMFTLNLYCNILTE